MKIVVTALLIASCNQDQELDDIRGKLKNLSADVAYADQQIWYLRERTKQFCRSLDELLTLNPTAKTKDGHRVDDGKVHELVQSFFVQWRLDELCSEKSPYNWEP